MHLRVPLSLLGGCLMALLLFALMLAMVAPPSRMPSDEPISVASFVRADGDSNDTATRNRQQAPKQPEPPTPQPPAPPTPNMATPNANLPKLDLELPTLDSGIQLSSAPTPSLNGLSAAKAQAPAPAPSAPSTADDAGGGKLGGDDSEVVPLNDVRPNYPDFALRRGIEGYVKLAFTINRAGRVENVRVVESSPRNVFDREARRAAVRWRFAPRTEGGLSVDREAVKTLYFRLEGGNS